MGHSNAIKPFSLQHGSFSMYIPVTYTNDLALREQTPWLLAPLMACSWSLERREGAFVNSSSFIGSPWCLFIPSFPRESISMGVGMFPCLWWKVMPTSSIYMYILIENIKAGVTCLPPLFLDWEKCKLTKAVLKVTAFGEACLASNPSSS